MAEPVIMPKFGMTMTEGTIVSWEKNIGDQVKKGEVILKIESDKAIMDVEAERDGYLVTIVAKPDDLVQCGEPIAFIADAPE